MKKIADIAAYAFMVSVALLSVISILGIWDFFQEDVIGKSFQSIGLLAVVAIIVIMADHFMDKKAIPTNIGPKVNMETGEVFVTDASHGVFIIIRKITLVLLIASAAFLALLGILAIWEVLSGDVLHKSLASLAIMAFSSFVIVLTCLEREGNLILKKKRMSGGMIVLIVFTALILMRFAF